MAPEHIIGGKTAPAADLYALGALLYMCRTGNKPLGQGTLLDTSPFISLDQHQTQGQ